MKITNLTSVKADSIATVENVFYYVSIENNRIHSMSARKRAKIVSDESPFPNHYDGYVVPTSDGSTSLDVVDCGQLQKYVDARQPCLVRLADEKQFRSMKRLTDLAYLKRTCGDAMVRVESRATTADSYGLGNESKMKVLFLHFVCARFVVANVNLTNAVPVFRLHRFVGEE
jgi:hypothetical protein